MQKFSKLIASARSVYACLQLANVHIHIKKQIHIDLIYRNYL